ncbi:hypothetical protein VNO77_20544 [Canavalia gladiata]|uniref:Uncharacterized protein n=1 Tax=Canavalia gladiata TaxID=3824 RepID=A0AAN9QQN5_CANGL
MTFMDIFCASQASTTISVSVDQASCSSSNPIQLGSQTIDRHNPIINDSRRSTSKSLIAHKPIPYSIEELGLLAIKERRCPSSLPYAFRLERDFHNEERRLPTRNYIARDVSMDWRVTNFCLKGEREYLDLSLRRVPKPPLNESETAERLHNRRILPTAAVKQNPPSNTGRQIPKSIRSMESPNFWLGVGLEEWVRDAPKKGESRDDVKSMEGLKGNGEEVGEESIGNMG